MGLMEGEEGEETGMMGEYEQNTLYTYMKISLDYTVLCLVIYANENRNVL